MKGIQIIYDDEGLAEFFNHAESNPLDGRTPLYLLPIPEFQAIAVSEDPFTVDEALEAAEQEEKEDDESAEEFDEQ